ncbi:ATP-binding cassette domain-containing protein [Blastopirellula marina]|uniref:ATP-binding cassette domain-containing protein n=1 Tax=Blastopirellula marina TaxID=124 RepID=UPI001304C4CD|nr:ATP-binding cassette domain-containing protein [Blastopirellula marina]
MKGLLLVVERISLVQAGRVFSGKWALRGIDATLEAGKIYALLGANGAGKSTLLQLLAGWLPLSEGRILLDESPMRPTAVHLRRKVMLLEESTGRPRGVQYTPTRVLCQAIQDYDVQRSGIEDEIADWYDRLDVTSVYDKEARSMSKGQAYKISMIGLFLIAPNVWLLDEPFSAGLDANGLKILETQLRTHAERGGIVLFTSQWPEHARRLADGALVLDEGKLVWIAPPRQSPKPEIAVAAQPSLQAVLQGLGPE